ncbi:MAG: glycerophosphodiester phosphodiesterase family protein [Clostridia bacterium]|nr:glycerophosphodiester phosphodiesterase family protein [Clostridia bacterium]
MKKTLPLFLLVAMLLIGCNSDTPAPAGTDTTAPADTTAEEVITMKTFVGGENEYTLVRPEGASQALIDQVIAFRADIVKQIPAASSMPFSDDWVKPGETGKPYEILVGRTNRPETEAVLADLRYHDYAIRVIGDKLVILGASDEKTAEAMNFFLENCVTAEGITLPSNYSTIVRGEYAYENVTLGGVPLQQYKVVYATGAAEAAKQLAASFGEEFGCIMETYAANSLDAGEYEIVLGSTNRKQLGSAGFYEYAITVEGKSIYVNGYDTYAYEAAIATIRDAIIAGSGSVSELSSLAASYTLPDRQAYIKDPSLLYMRWALRDDVAPDWLLDYDARKAALGSGTNGRMMTISHRADFQYYPENSIESIISCYYLGIDILELDIQPTKDNVLVLMHDTTLTRMTDAADYIGKPGYPNSDKVSDWTLEQIKTLRLKEHQGGGSAKLTQFRVPTLEEALIVCKNRMFVVPDKQDYWKYIDTDEIMKTSGNAYLYTDMVAADNYESILISYRVTTAEGVNIQKQIKDRTGVTPLIYIRVTADAMPGNYVLMQRSCAEGTYLLQINGAFTPNDSTINSYVKAISQVGGTTVGAWTITDETDIASVWQTMQDVGIDIIMTNHPHELVDFVIANQEKLNAAK